MAVWSIKKEATFEAAHKLVGLPDGHKCGRLHGHSYRVIVVMKAIQLDDVGFVMDFGAISRVAKELDHQDLNRVLSPLNPTAEVIAKWFAEQMDKELYLSGDTAVEECWVESVTVCETCTCEATYYPRLVR